MRKLLLVVTVSLISNLSIAQSTATKTDVGHTIVKTLEGKDFNTADITNDGKPFIIDFWATWCKPCVAELDAINENYKQWQEETGIKVFAVSIDDINITQNVGVGENAVTETISVFPIPSAGNVSLTLNQLNVTSFTLVVTDMAGKTISREENVANNGTLNVDLSTLENGSYLINIETPGQKIVKKVILEK